MVNDQMNEGFGGTFWSWVFFKKWNLFDSVKSISICYGLFALIFGFLAVITAIIYIPLQQYKLPYADFNGCLSNTNNNSKDHTNISSRCEVTFQITKQMSPPVHFLYYIENAYINHRNYLNSYSKKQLEGIIIDQKTAKDKCTPFVYNRDLGKSVSWNGKQLDPDAIASPCGFKAFLFFNDTYKLKRIDSNQVQNISIDESKIGQIQGLGIDFKSRNPDEQWINPADEHFMMWMQTQALMTKQKLWGRISQTLYPGKYSLLVQNHFQINKMRITKGIRITQASDIGGKTYIIPSLFGVGAIGCLIYAIWFYRKFSIIDQKVRRD